MWKKISRHNLALAFGAGAAFVLAFLPFHVAPLIAVFPALLYVLAERCRGFREGFAYGFVTSFVVNAGGFYWMIYTIHEFGYMPYPIATLLFLVFCGFGALHFPLFVGSASWLMRRFPALLSPDHRAAWLVLGLPALYSLFEFFVPKLFPFFAGHSLYWLPLLTQITELTGSIYLTFMTQSVAGLLVLIWLARRRKERLPTLGWAVPAALVVVCLGFGAYRFRIAPPAEGKAIRVALVQANIGSLEKVAARQGIYGRVRHVVGRYRDLTVEALKQQPRPDLVVWPETAMPFQLATGTPYALEIEQYVRDWGVPLVTGAYARHDDPNRDYNAAFLLSPEDGAIRTDVYRKHVLLAFGEYFPGGDTFPVLYKWFPQVSNFGRGTEQNPFVLADGTRLGATVCYEALIPSFYRKTVQAGVHAVVNLTNDSWFGPTTEPAHHGALASFRAVETRVPLIRATNTGISFVVDALGRISEATGVYEEGVLVVPVRLAETLPQTFYTRFGDWFILVMAIVLGWLVAIARRSPAGSNPKPHETLSL